MLSNHLEIFTHRFAKWAGSASGFIVALMSIIVWLVAGEIYNFSHAWESGMVVYIGVITFLMIFLMQRGQNKELKALHVKLNELIAVTKEADNKMINVEDLTEKEISEVQDAHLQIKINEIEKLKNDERE